MEPAHFQTLLEPGFDVDGGFRTQFVVGVHLEGSEARANELFGNGWEAEALADTGPEPRRLGCLKVQTCAEHGLGGGAVVDAEMLVACARGEVESLAGFLVDLQVGRTVGGGVDAFWVAPVVKLCGAAGQLLNGPGSQHQAIHAPHVAALLHLVFGVEDVARVALAVVVVVVEVLPAVAEAVLGATGRQVLDVGIHRADELAGARGCTVRAAVQPIVCTFPNECVERLAELPIGVEPKLQSLNAGVPSAQIHVESTLAVRPKAVHVEGIVIHGGGVHGHEHSADAVLVNLRALESVVSEEVASNHDIPTAELLAVKETEVALLQGAVPVFALFRATWVAVHPVLQTHPRERSGVGIPRPNVDHATECRAAVKDRTGPFDDFDLFQVLEGQEAPRGPARIAAEHREVVDEDHHARACAVAEAAAASDLGFAVDQTHAGRLLDGGFEGRRGFVFHQRRLQHLKGDRHFRRVLLKTTRRDHDEPEGFGRGRHDGVPLRGLACGEFNLELLLGHADEGAHDGVLARLQFQGVRAIHVGGDGDHAVGQVGANHGLFGPVEHAALDGLGPSGGCGAQKATQGQEGGEK